MGLLFLYFFQTLGSGVSNAVRAVVLKLYKHAETLCSFPSFCRTSFLLNTTESKMGY